MITYHDARPEDAPHLVHLVTQLAIYEKYPDAVTATVDDYKEVLENGLIESILAYDEDTKKHIGMALFYLTFSTWKGKMLYLEDFFVEPSYRRHGIGQELFDRYLQKAREKGCILTKWEVLTWNEPAINFYKKNKATIDDEFLDCKLYL